MKQDRAADIAAQSEEYCLARMGRFAQVMGIGVRSVVQIDLPKGEFYAGEFVMGHVQFIVTEPIDADGFVLTLHGREHLSWHVRAGKQDHHHRIKHEFFTQQIPFMAVPTLVQPGEYVYPFQFQLAPGLPSTQVTYKRSVEHITRVLSSVTYEIKARVKVKGMLKADIGSAVPIGVHAFPMPLQQGPRPVEDSTTRQVYFMCCFNQGPCGITGASSTNAVDLLKGFVQVRGSVRNNSSKKISTLSVNLYQDLTVHIPDGYPHSGLRRTGNCQPAAKLVDMQ